MATDPWKDIHWMSPVCFLISHDPRWVSNYMACIIYDALTNKLAFSFVASFCAETPTIGLNVANHHGLCTCICICMHVWGSKAKWSGHQPANGKVAAFKNTLVLLLFPWARNFTHIGPVNPPVKWRPGVNWRKVVTSMV